MKRKGLYLIGGLMLAMGATAVNGAERPLSAQDEIILHA